MNSSLSLLGDKQLLSFLCLRTNKTSRLGVFCNTPKYTLAAFDMFRVFCKCHLNVS